MQLVTMVDNIGCQQINAIHNLYSLVQYICCLSGNELNIAHLEECKSESRV